MRRVGEQERLADLAEGSQLSWAANTRETFLPFGFGPSSSVLKPGS